MCKHHASSSILNWSAIRRSGVNCRFAIWFTVTVFRVRTCFRLVIQITEIHQWNCCRFNQSAVAIMRFSLDSGTHHSRYRHPAGEVPDLNHN